jgi:glycosyltransferase involved in cell wall biosynthesis
VQLARTSRCKVLLNVSDLWPLSLQELGALRQGLFYRFLERLERKMYRNASAYTGQSEAILAHIRTIAGQEKKMFLYRNLQASSAFAQRPRPTGRRSIVYAGLLGVAQGVYEICKTIDFAASGISFHIYGDGNEKEKILALIAQHPGCNIFYHGSVPAAGIPEVLSHYHCTLIPLRTAIKGALPSKVFMAIANGLPALYCGGGEGAAIVAENGIGWVSEPGNYEQLKNNIATLAQTDEATYASMRNRCLHLAQTTFSKEVQDEAFYAFITDL